MRVFAMGAQFQVSRYSMPCTVAVAIGSVSNFALLGSGPRGTSACANLIASGVTFSGKKSSLAPLVRPGH